ncbi:MAG: hypothetical protein JWN15_1700 [Firmicutes bacterium]|nr:hypothetical protein [Bacillota bacterium]
MYKNAFVSKTDTTRKHAISTKNATRGTRRIGSNATAGNSCVSSGEAGPNKQRVRRAHLTPDLKMTTKEDPAWIRDIYEIRELRGHIRIGTGQTAPLPAHRLEAALPLLLIR